MAKKHQKLVSIRLICANQTDLQKAAMQVLTHFGSHLLSLAMGSNTMVVYLSPLDPQLFREKEGVEYIGGIVKECLPFTAADVVCSSIRLHYEKGGRA